jgi:ribonucleoside-diphosphate reductase beta chain
MSTQDSSFIAKNLIFNPAGNDDVGARTIIKGSTTGLFNLNAVKYPWAKSLYQVMVGNFWLPEKVSGLKDDQRDFSSVLNADEQRAYKGILSFLIFLDSIQTVNLPNFNDYITSPEVNLILSIQAYQEAIHSQSYATILESVVSPEERDEIYYFWRENKILLERNTYIGQIYQDFVDNPTDASFFRGVVANFLLESIYFYN